MDGRARERTLIPRPDDFNSRVGPGTLSFFERSKEPRYVGGIRINGQDPEFHARPDSIVREWKVRQEGVQSLAHGMHEKSGDDGLFGCHPFSILGSHDVFTDDALANRSGLHLREKGFSMKMLRSTRLQTVFFKSVPMLLAALMSGCATTSDLEALQKQVVELKLAATHAGSVAEHAKAAAHEASNTANAALSASGQAMAASSEASTSAQRAEKTAAEASSTASNALSVSDQAKGASKEALSNSQRATQAATEAKIKAYDASTKASSASFTAEHLKSMHDAKVMQGSVPETAGGDGAAKP
jgi:hypothetical protein